MAAMHRYDLPLPASTGRTPTPTERVAAPLKPHELLLRNAAWYCRIRWVIGIVFLILGGTGQMSTAWTKLGFRSGLIWPFIIAGILISVNTGFVLHLRHAGRRSDGRGAVRANLWTQILFDLVIVTLVVHKVGSLETPIAFIYLFHIVLGCLFLSLRQSFAVMLLACACYGAVVGGELMGWLSAAGIYADTAMRESVVASAAATATFILTAIGVWSIVWYLASQLSRILRRRELQLEEANTRLERMQKEKVEHMLRTTHELKSPFAAIQASTQLLLKGYCGDLSDDVIEVVERISQRSRKLTTSIQAMLELSNLRSETERPVVRDDIDLVSLADWCVTQVGQIAKEFDITVEKDFRLAHTTGAESHLQMLLVNLLANAVLYSQRGGKVMVEIKVDSDDIPVIIIKDDGIGIPAEKLPLIFDEYFHTNEAAQHNKYSTGLGLAIVRHVAETHGIEVRVESEPGVGTVFTLRFAGGINPIQRRTGATEALV